MALDRVGLGGRSHGPRGICPLRLTIWIEVLILKLFLAGDCFVDLRDFLLEDRLVDLTGEL